MGMSDKVWDALTTVLRMNDRVVALSETVKAQQLRIEDLSRRVIRLETALEIALATGRRKPLPAGERD
jgi:hypothetical protein